MATVLSAEASDEEILRLVEGWIDALVVDDYAAAFALSDHDPYYRWSPSLMRAVVAGYGLPTPHPSGTEFVVTARDQAAGAPAYREVDRDVHPPGAIADVRHSLPLNGEWSDLTVTFRVERRAAGNVLVLEEIHVF